MWLHSVTSCKPVGIDIYQSRIIFRDIADPDRPVAFHIILVLTDGERFASSEFLIIPRGCIVEYSIISTLRDWMGGLWCYKVRFCNEKEIAILDSVIAEYMAQLELE